jgi:hypothetical protein
MIGIAGPLLAVVLGVLTYLIPRRTLASHGQEGERFAGWMLAGFLLRLAANPVIRSVALFSHGGPSQGDASIYESAAWVVARLWEYEGVGWYSVQEIGVDGAHQALLAVHIYGAIAYLNGGETSPVGCVALNAFLAAITCLHLVRLGTMIKGGERESRIVALVTYFSPAFVFHTSDMFKDGISAFLVISAVLIAFRLSERFHIVDAVLGAGCLVLLWFVRYYLVFLVTAPLVFSFLGLRRGASARFVLASAVMMAVGMILVATNVADDAISAGVSTYDYATAETSLAWNARAGSGVTFTGSPVIAFPLRLAYTLFSPFPWDFRSTSIGFQVGKLDALIWYYFLFYAIRGGRQMWKDDRGTLLMFLVVLLPLTVAYATTMANIGLIVRQRMPIVMLGAVLAVRGLPLAMAARATSTAAPVAGLAHRRST